VEGGSNPLRAASSRQSRDLPSRPIYKEAGVSIHKRLFLLPFCIITIQSITSILLFVKHFFQKILDNIIFVVR
jgi:hypothetical protein